MIILHFHTCQCLFQIEQFLACPTCSCALVACITAITIVVFTSSSIAQIYDLLYIYLRRKAVCSTFQLQSINQFWSTPPGKSLESSLGVEAIRVKLKNSQFPRLSGTFFVVTFRTRIVDNFMHVFNGVSLCILLPLRFALFLNNASGLSYLHFSPL